MQTFVRILVPVTLFAIGYYLGKQIGRLESVRKQLETSEIQSRRLTGANSDTTTNPETSSSEPGS
jgi:hypothetical protein